MRCTGFRQATAKVLLSGLEVLEDKITEYKVSLLDGVISIDPDLVTENVDEDIDTLTEVWQLIEGVDEMEEFDIEPGGFEYLKAGLLFYREELVKVQSRVKTQSLKHEISSPEVNSQPSREDTSS